MADERIACAFSSQSSTIVRYSSVQSPIRTLHCGELRNGALVIVRRELRPIARIEIVLRRFVTFKVPAVILYAIERGYFVPVLQADRYGLSAPDAPMRLASYRERLPDKLVAAHVSPLFIRADTISRMRGT